MRGSRHTAGKTLNIQKKKKRQAPSLPFSFAPILGYLPQGASVAKPNYKFDKRQRDLAKQKKKEDKLAKKAAKKAADTAPESGTETLPGDGTP